MVLIFCLYKEGNKLMKKVIKYILILTLTLFLVVVIGLFIYTSDSYDAQKINE